MSQLDDYIDLIAAGLKIARANRDMWGEATESERRAWFKTALDDAFSGKYYSPENRMINLIKSVNPNNLNIQQFWIENTWAHDLYLTRMAQWDAMVQTQGNPAFWRMFFGYTAIVIVIGLIIYLVYRYKKSRS